MKTSVHMVKLFFVLALFCAAALVAAPMQKAKSGNNSLVGQWQGDVTAGDAQMGISVEVKTETNKLVGQINTAHGAWAITEVKQANGKWVIAWRTPEGGTGKMSGVLKDNHFAGDWDFSPAFVGTFALTRK